MTVSEMYAREWRAPDSARGVAGVSYSALKRRASEEWYSHHFVRAIKDGIIYVVSDLFSPAECVALIDAAYAFGQSEPPSFHKIVEGCPNFHRIIDNQNTGAYSVTSMRHGYYFYRWNGRNMIYDIVDEKLALLKTLCGLPPDAYENATPKDGVVERVVMYSYPRGGGFLGTHVDPTNNHPLVMGCTLSARGTDFTSGGLYAVRQDGSHMDLEPHMGAGALMLCYPTVRHGVAPVDSGVAVDWDTKAARWFIGFSMVDSDHVAERVTAQRVAD